MALEKWNVLTLGDGTELEGSCGYAEKNLWCWIRGKTLAQCFGIFSDLQKTKEITICYFRTKIIYKGFTRLIDLHISEETVDICLTWPEDGEHSIEVLPIEEEGMQHAESGE